MIAARLAVTAAFARATPGYRNIPSRPPTTAPVTIYHANPHRMRDGLRRIVPGPARSSTPRRCTRRKPPPWRATRVSADGLTRRRRWTTTSGRWTNSAAGQGSCQAGSVMPKDGVVICTSAFVPRTQIHSPMRSAATF